jgi:signal transduction histidine kinase
MRHGQAAVHDNAVKADPDHSQPAERSARAAENITALGEMTRGIAHDFRNVLCMLTSGLNIAEANADDPAKLRLALEAIRAGVARGLKITNHLLEFARQQEFRPHAEDINELLRSLDTFLSYGAGPGIRVVLELLPDLPRCVVDPRQLSAAILNLVVNARDAMPEGGIIRIGTALVHRQSRGHARHYVRVRVRDNGAGMAPDVLAKVFDPFFTTKGADGTGLGIPQVQAMMDKLGGFLTARSSVGKGAQFDLFFPVSQEPRHITPKAWRPIDRWADEGGAIGSPPVVEVTP